MKLKGHFLTKDGIAWSIPGRETQRMYRERVYKPPPGWRFRRNIDYTKRDKAGFYVLKGSIRTDGYAKGRPAREPAGE